MSDGGRNEPSNLIDRYLDGLLSGPERAEFERRLESEPELRAGLELQTQINASLSRSFVVPTPERVMGPVRTARSSASRWSIPHLLRSRWVALAASLLLVLGVWTAWRAGQPNTFEDYPVSPNWYSMEMVYRMETAKGFKPQWVCDSERELATTYWQQLDQPLAIPIPAEKKGWGLSYFNTLSPKTVVLLAKVNDTPVMVFADRAERADKEKDVVPSPESNLKAHRRQVGDLVLYEVSPLPKPHLLDEFYEPKMPQEWKDNPVRPGKD
jgi:hypothetical protein